MSSEYQNQAELIAQTLDDDDLIPLGERKAQEVGENDAIYLPFPQPHARNQGLEQSSPVKVYFHPSTKAVIWLPL